MQSLEFKRFTITEKTKIVKLYGNETYRDRDGKLDDETYYIGEAEAFSHYEILVERISLNVEKTLINNEGNNSAIKPYLFRKTLEIVSVEKKQYHDVLLDTPIVFTWGANDASGFSKYDFEKLTVIKHFGKIDSLRHEYSSKFIPLGDNLGELLEGLNKKQYK